MTPAQFEVLAEMLRARDSVRSAARAVLFGGATPTVAGEAFGMSPQGVSNALKRFRDAHAKVSDAYGSER